MSKDAPLAVEVPADRRDNPGWIKVGLIAAVGFGIGIAWPRVFDVRLGPTAPGAASAASASAPGEARRAPEAPSVSIVTKTTAPAVPSTAKSEAAPADAAPAIPAASPASPKVTARRAGVMSCKTGGDEKKGRDCGPTQALDQLVLPRVRTLSTCAALAGQSGKLSLVVMADFDASRFSYYVGKSTTVRRTDALGACIDAALDGVSLSGVAHEHARYSVAYTVMVGEGSDAATDEGTKLARLDEPKDERAASEPAPRKAREAKDERNPALATGEARVAWQTALVRDTPKTGAIVARLPQDTKVKVGAAKDGWYLIKYGDAFAREGWVYRGAIGR